MLRRCYFFLFALVAMTTGCSTLTTPVAPFEKAPTAVEVLTEVAPQGEVPRVSSKAANAVATEEQNKEVQQSEVKVTKPGAEDDLYLAAWLADKFKQPLDKILEILVEISKNTGDLQFPNRKDVLAIIAVESSFNPKAAYKGSFGLMQINKSAHKPKLRGKDVFDIATNIKLGIDLLKEYYALAGTIRGTVLSYNAGIGNYQKGRYNILYWKKFLARREELN